MRRSHQCSTIELDFQFPERFNLTYASGEGDGKLHPVIIHQAILGSVEKMIAILAESFGGKWILWLSPQQVVVIPVSSKYNDYSEQKLHAAGYRVDTDLDHGSTLNKKVRNAQLSQYNFIPVVGEKETVSDTVNVRTRDNKVLGEKSVMAMIERLQDLVSSRSLTIEDF
ncbi:threonine--tRNA ligase 1, cytoplasmic-like [Xenia sp. Carnegie-2017]|uniref:threonine--tRNA ligase 1, cytoplasmic-like n=1 Tax=Xenia sp. Carnegie-2017 TaxID=2897299 RepID=UPI001F03BE4B|nr:threonine--tRNA ligase 1, cytoplasmic-like [Xenia sp. Carnegie-2017]